MPSKEQRKRKILLLTNAERGQANVFLATCHSLLELGAEVHFGSFPAIRSAVEETLPGAKFFELKGPDMKESWGTSGVERIAKTEIRAAPNFWNMASWIRLCLLSLFPWSGPEFVEIYKSVLDALDTIDPDMAVVDPAFSPGLTACRASGRSFTILAPNTIKEFSMFSQGAWDIFFKYPWQVYRCRDAARAVLTWLQPPFWSPVPCPLVLYASERLVHHSRYHARRF
jgi:hypothetical protein